MNPDNSRNVKKQYKLMAASFWSNTIWYISLFVTSVISMVFVQIKTKYRKFTIGFTLATLGLVLYIESILVISFNSYSYQPKIVNDLFQDSVLGNIASQVSVSATSALIIAYDLSFRYYIVFAFIYYLIEELFVKLGIYTHFWYRSVYTLIGFTALFWFVKLWRKKLIESSKYYLHYITLYLSSVTAVAETINLPLKLLDIQVFSIDFYGIFTKNHTATMLIYDFFLMNIIINLYRWRLHWIWKSFVIAFLFLIQYILFIAGVVYIKNSWFFAVTLLDMLGRYGWVIVIDSFLRGKPASA